MSNSHSGHELPLPFYRAVEVDPGSFMPDEAAVLMQLTVLTALVVVGPAIAATALVIARLDARRRTQPDTGSNMCSNPVYHPRS